MTAIAKKISRDFANLRLLQSSSCSASLNLELPIELDKLLILIDNLLRNWKCRIFRRHSREIVLRGCTNLSFHFRAIFKALMALFAHHTIIRGSRTPRNVAGEQYKRDLTPPHGHQKINELNISKLGLHKHDIGS